MEALRRTARRVGALFAAVLVAGLAVTTLSAAPPPDRGPTLQGDRGPSLDLDARKGKKAPSARQEALAEAKGATVRWNRFGTPETLITYGGYLATGLTGDDVSAARQFLRANAELVGLSPDAIDELELVTAAPIGNGSAVLLRQRFGNLASGHDGLVTVGVTDGKIAYLSSSLAPGSLSGSPAISAAEAVRAAAAGMGVAIGTITNTRIEDGWTVMDVEGLSMPARARLVALPTPESAVRPAYETIVADNGTEPRAATSYIDAETRAVLVREDLVDYETDNPTWKVFTASPSLDYSSTDIRELWCWTPGAAGCQRAVGTSASPLAWDVDPATGSPSLTTLGNNARAVHNWFSNNPFSVGTESATPSPGRDYVYGWTNQWFGERCNPDTTFTSLQRNDIDAARANLFAMHNRMHDWSYHLGFTAQTFNLQGDNFGLGGLGNDPEQGNAQAGGVSGGPASGFAARDNANQITPPDGIAPITNMYLWQPIAGAFYAPCVDGDFDMSVIGHEYTHAISNRMVAGPSVGLSGAQAGAMGESWSDLAAVEYLAEYGFTPLAGENPFAVGPYVTKDHRAGIRNYGMNESPLNYSNVGYDFVCNAATCPLLTQVHADGEIWSATNYDIRQALTTRYGAGDPGLQASCANGLVPVASCPGNRRWIQLVFDAWLLMPSQVSMVDARDAMLAADVVRFGGANQDLLWNAFARRGLGDGASSNGANDADPTPSFVSPYAQEATVTFKPIGEGADATPIVARLFVGDYEARSAPVADTDPATPLGDTFKIVPGTYDFLVASTGYGHARLTQSFNAGQVRDLPVLMQRNVAAAVNGATITGDGVNLGKLIDETEATNWASLGVPVQGRQVTIRLDPSKPWHQIERIQVSALLRTRIPADPVDAATQNRFSALRQFEILTCEVKAGVDCTQDAQFTSIFTSPDDAFPAIAPRPRAPDLVLRSFEIPRTKATHVRLRVLQNQCTGAPDYQGDQDDDPLNVTDCGDGSTQDDNVRAAELQIFVR